MHFTAAFLAVPLLALNVVAWRPFDREYFNIGCPINTTKPYASQREQLEAIEQFGDLLYLQKKVLEAEYTYVARDFINHAPEIAGNGRDVAIKLLVPMLNTSTIEIQNVFTGRNRTGHDFSVTYFKGNSSRFGVGVIADVWRMIGTCLVEHWDVATGVENSTNPIAYF